MSDEVGTKRLHIEMIPVEKIKPNSWNPNAMDDDTFNRLAEELDEENGGVGYIDLIQVVPMDDGTYTLVGGEHRWRALKVLGNEAIECIVLDGPKWKDTDLQKFVTVRLNVLHGKMNSQKFMDLYMDLSSKYDDEAMQQLMAVTDKDAWKLLTKDVRKGLEDVGATKEQLEKFDEVTKELKTVDDLAVILNKIFTDHGSTLDQNFMYFSFGGKEHLYVQCNPSTWQRVKAMMDQAKKTKTDANDVFGQLLAKWKDMVTFMAVADETRGEASGEAEMPVS